MPTRIVGLRAANREECELSADPDPPVTERARREQATAAVAAARAEILQRAAAALPTDEADALAARLDRYGRDAALPLAWLYGDREDYQALVARLLRAVVDAAAARPHELRRLDRRREIDPEWFLRETMVGYVCYADRFAGDLDGVRERVGYLEELGVRYLHLMPLLAARDGEDDGGYAVVDFDRVDPRLGSNDDLEALAGDLHERDMALCVDLVINHTAAEHAWAERAKAGDPYYQAFYLTFPDRTLPDAYERTVPETFPDTAPGNFTWSPELSRWVWTTFYPFQWDLDHSNPEVFAALLDVMLRTANRGVDVLRLDAVRCLWKRLGTTCENLPEAHWLLQAWRGLTRIATPGVVFKAEAIVGPDQLVQYLGAHDQEQPECELAYHNQLMVMSWSAVASRDARLPTVALDRLADPPRGTGWVTYVRCHDDIGWAVDDADAATLGLSGFAHRRFLAEFYAGQIPGSFARGAMYQDDPRTGDARTSGMAAALAGLTQAREVGDPLLLDQAVRRLLLLHAIAYGWGGLPLLWMGDEIAMGNDDAWWQDPVAGDDNRWMHRPHMDWVAAQRRHREGSVEHRVFSSIAGLAAARRRTPELHAIGPTRPVWTDNPKVLAWRREHPRFGTLLGLANVDDADQSVDAGILDVVRAWDPVDVLDDDRPVPVVDGRIPVPRLSARWVVAP